MQSRLASLKHDKELAEGLGDGNQMEEDDDVDLAAKLETLQRLQTRMAMLQSQQLAEEADAGGGELDEPDTSAGEALLAEKLARLKSLEAQLAGLQQPAGEPVESEEELDLAYDNDDALPADPEVREQLVRMRELQGQLAKLREQKRELDAAEEAMAVADGYTQQHTVSVGDNTTVDEEAELRALTERKSELLRMRDALMAVRDSQVPGDHSAAEIGYDADDTVDDDDDATTPENLATLERLREQLRRLQDLKRKTLLANQLMKGPEAAGQLAGLTAEKQENELQKRKRVVGALREELEAIHLEDGWDDGSTAVALDRPPTTDEMADDSSVGQARTLLEHIRALHSRGQPDEFDSTKSTDGSVAHSLADSAAAMAATASTPVERLKGMLDELAQQQGMLDRMQAMQANGTSDPDSPRRLRSLLPLPEEDEIDILSQVRQYDEEEQYIEDHGNVYGLDESDAGSHDAVALGGGAQEDAGAADWAIRESESSFQNLKLATLYAESLHPLHREDFLRIFFKYSRDSSTAAIAFQLSFDAFLPPTGEDDSEEYTSETVVQEDTEYGQVYRASRRQAPRAGSDRNASVSVLVDDTDFADRRQPETPQDPLDFDDVKDDIYREVRSFCEAKLHSVCDSAHVPHFSFMCPTIAMAPPLLSFRGLDDRLLFLLPGTSRIRLFCWISSSRHKVFQQTNTAVVAPILWANFCRCMRGVTRTGILWKNC
jgi:hypothetical protein